MSLLSVFNPTFAWHDSRVLALYGDFERALPGPELWVKRGMAAERRLCDTDLDPTSAPLVFSAGSEDTVVWLEVDGGLGVWRSTTSACGSLSMAAPPGPKSNLVGAGGPGQFTVAFRMTSGGVWYERFGTSGSGLLPGSVVRGSDTLAVTDGTSPILYGIRDGGAVFDLSLGSRFGSFHALGIATTPSAADVLAYLDPQFIGHVIVSGPDFELGEAARSSSGAIRQ